MANTEATDESRKITVVIIDANRFFRQGIRASLIKYDDDIRKNDHRFVVA